MKNIDQAVRKETGYIAFSAIILSALMESVFLIIGKWDYTVLLGNVLSVAAAVLNFFLMGITVQKVTQMEEKTAQNRIKASQAFRMLFLFIIAAIGAWVSCFHIAAVLIPLFFPRIAIGVQPLLQKNNKNEA